MKPTRETRFSQSQLRLLRQVLLEGHAQDQVELRYDLPPGTIKLWMQQLLDDADDKANAGLASSHAPLLDAASAHAHTPDIEIPHLLTIAMDSISEMVTITDLQDRFVYVNRSFCQKYEYTLEEILGERPTLLVPPGAVAKVFPAVTDATRRGGWRGELQNHTKSGRLFTVHLSTAPIRNEHGELCGLIGISRDISKTVSQERETGRAIPSWAGSTAKLQESHQRFLTLLRSTPLGLCMVGTGWVIQYANPALARLLRGPDPMGADLAGISFQSIFPSDDDFRAFRTWIQQSFKSPGTPSREILLRRADGTVLRSEVFAVRCDPFQTDPQMVLTFSGAPKGGTLATGTGTGH